MKLLPWLAMAPFGLMTGLLSILVLFKMFKEDRIAAVISLLGVFVFIALILSFAWGLDEVLK